MSDMTQIKAEIEAAAPVKGTVPNPEYDPSQPYIPRSQRKEWTSVGLIGKVHVQDNGACVVGGKCDCVDGIAVPGTHWRVLKRSDANTIRILYK